MIKKSHAGLLFGLHVAVTSAWSMAAIDQQRNIAQAETVSHLESDPRVLAETDMAVHESEDKRNVFILLSLASLATAAVYARVINNMPEQGQIEASESV